MEQDFTINDLLHKDNINHILSAIEQIEPDDMVIIYRKGEEVYGLMTPMLADRAVYLLERVKKYILDGI